MLVCYYFIHFVSYYIFSLFYVKKESSRKMKYKLIHVSLLWFYSIFCIWYLVITIYRSFISKRKVLEKWNTSLFIFQFCWKVRKIEYNLIHVFILLKG